MAAVDDPKTYGRARLGFADQADVDEFADTLERFERGEIGPDAWRAFRLVRGTYGQRQAEDAQMLRVKIPQGVLTGAADPRARRRRRSLFARLRSHHDPAERAVSLHEAARRRAGDAPHGRRRADHARGVRQLGAKHHRLSVRRRRRRRGVRRDAVRRGADAPSAAPSAQLEAAAQVQDRLRGLPRGSHPDRRSTTSASAPRSARTGTRGFRVTVAGGTSIMPRAGALLHDVPAGGGDLRRRRRDPPRLRRARRLPAQAAQPAQVPDQEPGLGALATRSTRPPWPRCASSRSELPVRSRRPAGRSGRRTGCPPPAPTLAEIVARDAAAELRGPGIHPAPIEAGHRRLRSLDAHQRAAAEAGRLRRRRRHDPARRRHRGAAPDLRGSRVGVRRRHRARSPPIRTRSFAGYRWRVSRSSTARSPPPASGSPTRARSPTSSAAPAPSRAASP